MIYCFLFFLSKVFMFPVKPPCIPYMLILSSRKVPGIRMFQFLSVFSPAPNMIVMICLHNIMIFSLRVMNVLCVSFPLVFMLPGRPWKTLNAVFICKSFLLAYFEVLYIILKYDIALCGRAYFVSCGFCLSSAVIDIYSEQIYLQLAVLFPLFFFFFFHINLPSCLKQSTCCCNLEVAVSV